MQIEQIQQEIVPVVTTAKGIVITNQAEMEVAAEIAQQIKVKQKMVKDQKDLIIKPFNEGLKNTRAMFKPIEDALSEAEMAVKQAMLKKNREDREREEKERLEAQKLFEAETKNNPAAQKQVESLVQKAEKTVTTTTFKKVKSVRVIDESALPREYLVPDMVAIRRDALAGKEISGVVVVEEDQVATRRF